MDIDDDAEWARMTGPEETTVESSDTHLAMLAPSLLDIVKRRLRDGTIDRDRLAYELGDVLYDWARPCAAAGVVPSALLTESRRQIEARLARRAQGGG